MPLAFATLLAFFISIESSTAFAHVGVLIGSFGDIDHPKTELRSFVRKTLTDPDILPLPAWARHSIANIGWYIERSSLFEKYAAIGGSSHMRRESHHQAMQVQHELRLKHRDATVYSGFTMTFPFVEDALTQAQADGVTRLIVLHQGAQYARDTVGILMRHVQEYIKNHPGWQVEVHGVMSFSDDRS
jgi:protoheme ferro-lyase